MGIDLEQIIGGGGSKKDIRKKSSGSVMDTDKEKKLKSKGRNPLIFTSDKGDTSKANVGLKALLGQ